MKLYDPLLVISRYKIAFLKLRRFICTKSPQIHLSGDEHTSSFGRRLRQASAMSFASFACPFANSWKARPMSDVFCSWNRTISSFINLTINSNLLVASSLSAFNCINPKQSSSRYPSQDKIHVKLFFSFLFKNQKI